MLIVEIKSRIIIFSSVLPNMARNGLLSVFRVSDSGISPKTKSRYSKENKLCIWKYGFHEVTFVTDSWKYTIFFLNWYHRVDCIVHRIPVGPIICLTFFPSRAQVHGSVPHALSLLSLVKCYQGGLAALGGLRLDVTTASYLPRTTHPVLCTVSAWPLQHLAAGLQWV